MQDRTHLDLHFASEDRTNSRTSTNYKTRKPFVRKLHSPWGFGSTLESFSSDDESGKRPIRRHAITTATVTIL